MLESVVDQHRLHQKIVFISAKSALMFNLGPDTLHLEETIKNISRLSFWARNP
jgi:hypothetical protein